MFSLSRKPNKKKSRWFLSKNEDQKALSNILADFKNSNNTASETVKLTFNQEQDTMVKGLVNNATSADTSRSSEPQNFGAVCRITDSPFRILKVASSGNLKEFERLYNADNSRLSLQDSKGQTVFHHAATKSKVNIMDFILSHGGDINTQDKRGLTPLHVAVAKNQDKAVEFLLNNGANSSILNTEHMAPLHLAVELGNIVVLEALIKETSVDINIGGDQGYTPLHYAASKDRAECAKKLLDYKARLCKPCDIGYFPIHVAAKTASSKTLEILLRDGAEKLGYNTADVLKYEDKDRNMPLHCAVNGGDVTSVELCLKYGAQIDAKQNDGSTAVHLACAQGSFEMIKVMLEAQPDNKLAVINAVDVMGMTPLHTASLFDHVDIVAYLIEEGSQLNAVDNEERTPLLLASAKHAWRAVKLLLEKGANMELKDNKNRNFLHLAIMNGAKLQDFGADLFKNAKNLLDEKDDYGCSVVHYASREGHLPAVDGLIKLGAFLNIKNNDKQSPLHFAARYGRLNTCMRLLESAQGANIINETDGEGMTALHIASKNGHVKVSQCLLQRGAILHRDNKGNTPLHLAAENGYTQTMKLLLSVHSHILNAANKDGDTALHCAARAGRMNAVTLLMSMDAEFTCNKRDQHFFELAIENLHKDVAMAIVDHKRWREAMNLSSSVTGCPMLALTKNLPEVCLAVLDRCQTMSSHDKKSKFFYYHYDFRYLQLPMTLMLEEKTEGKEFEPMLIMNTMVKFNRVECLSHPVCVNFLQMKWLVYGMWFHMVNIIFYIVYLAFLTSFIVTFHPMQHTRSGHVLNLTTDMFVKIKSERYYFQFDTFHKVAMIVIGVFCAINMLKEIGQMFQQRAKYFMDFNNVLEWVLYITSAIFIGPAIIGFSTHMQWQCGAIAVFLAWFNLLLYLQRFDFFGIYVVMFLEILKTLLQVIVVFSILIVAFGLSFYILMCGEETHAHKTPGLSLMRTFIMMLGEIDYIDTFVRPFADNKPKTMHFDSLTFFCLILFVLLMPILLMNLLFWILTIALLRQIGLAVGDIEQVQKNARLKRLAMQVELHDDLERKLPAKFLKLVDKKEYKVFPNSGSQAWSKAWSKIMSGDEDEASGGEKDEALTQHSHVMEEMHRLRRKLKEMTASIEKQHELLRLIVQKMEIRTEADDKDVGSENLDSGRLRIMGTSHSWSMPSIRHNLMRQAAIVSKWSKAKDQP